MLLPVNFVLKRCKPVCAPSVISVDVEVGNCDTQECRVGSRAIRATCVASGEPMSRTELIIQLVKVVIGLAFGAYFLCGA